MDYPLLSKIICPSASSPRELRCIDSVDPVFCSVMFRHCYYDHLRGRNV